MEVFLLKTEDIKITKEEEGVGLLKNKGYHITFAESCTAGLASARLVMYRMFFCSGCKFFTYGIVAK